MVEHHLVVVLHHLIEPLLLAGAVVTLSLRLAHDLKAEILGAEQVGHARVHDQAGVVRLDVGVALAVLRPDDIRVLAVVVAPRLREPLESGLVLELYLAGYVGSKEVVHVSPNSKGLGRTRPGRGYSPRTSRSLKP